MVLFCGEAEGENWAVFFVLRSRFSKSVSILSHLSSTLQLQSKNIDVSVYHGRSERKRYSRILVYLFETKLINVNHNI